MRLPRSVRARTTIAAVAAVVPVLLVTGVAGVWFQHDDLTTGVGVLAEEQARTIAREVARGPLSSTLGGEENVVQVVSLADGQVLASSPGLDGTPLLSAPPGDAPLRREVTGVVSDEPDRYLAVALRTSDGASYVVVARSLESVDAATSSTTGLFAIGGVVVLLTVGALTWLTTGRALSPVESMRRRAASISADDLDARLPVPESDDEVARLASTFNDLLDRIADAAATQRRFVADASHELRSPVSTIRALVESDRITAHPGGHEGLAADVLDETARLTAVVDDLMLLARGDARFVGAHGPVDLSALARKEAHRARRLPVTLAVQDGVVATGDPQALAVAIRNLLDNAERHAFHKVTVAVYRAGTVARVEVADDGPGVPAEARERIFERFVRLDAGRSRAEGGTGLGLAIVRQVARDHGGTVRVEPTLPGAEPAGARFVLTLPAG